MLSKIKEKKGEIKDSKNNNSTDPTGHQINLQAIIKEFQSKNLTDLFPNEIIKVNDTKVWPTVPDYIDIQPYIHPDAKPILLVKDNMEDEEENYYYENKNKFYFIITMVISILLLILFFLIYKLKKKAKQADVNMIPKKKNYELRISEYFE